MSEVTPPGAEHAHRGWLRAWVAWWLLLAALWLLLVDLVAAPELLAGVAAVSIAATGAVLVRGQRDALLRPVGRWLGPGLRAVPSLVTDLVPLGRALWRRGLLRRDERGGIVALSYAATGEDGRDVAHRALTEALGSLGPNTIVVEIVRDRGVLRAHQLVPDAGVGRAARPLGERP